jgi:hypothetical protein
VVLNLIEKEVEALKVLEKEVLKLIEHPAETGSVLSLPSLSQADELATKDSILEFTGRFAMSYSVTAKEHSVTAKEPSLPKSRQQFESMVSDILDKFLKGVTTDLDSNGLLENNLASNPSKIPGQALQLAMMYLSEEVLQVALGVELNPSAFSANRSARGLEKALKINIPRVASALAEDAKEQMSAIAGSRKTKAAMKKLIKEGPRSPREKRRQLRDIILDGMRNALGGHRKIAGDVWDRQKGEQKDNKKAVQQTRPSGPGSWRAPARPYEPNGQDSTGFSWWNANEMRRQEVARLDLDGF